MGTDIYVHVEVLVDGQWEHYAAPSVNRWYRLFGLLAGVRDTSVVPISQPKGFPEDASKVTKLLYAHAGKSARTASWLSHDEIIKVEDELQKWGSEPRLEPYQPLEYHLEFGILHTSLPYYGLTMHWRSGLPCLPEGIDDVRLVFWFE